MQIDISFGVWKALTGLLRDENDSYNAVIERLLSDAPEVESRENSLEGVSLAKGELDQGAFFKNVFLPNGTELRATYKGQTYFAKISACKWVDQDTGATRSSPSQAAYSITGGNVNGWLFWLVRRPGDAEWRSLNSLRTYGESSSQ